MTEYSKVYLLNMCDWCNKSRTMIRWFWGKQARLMTTAALRILLFGVFKCFCCKLYIVHVRIVLITDRVRSTREGYVVTRVCPSVCLSTGGGFPSQIQPGGVPQPGLARGYPTWPGEGYPSQVQPEEGGTSARSRWRGRYPGQVQRGVSFVRPQIVCN